MDAVLRQQPEGNVLYILAHVESPTVPHPSIDDKQIQIHQSPDKVLEVTTFDYATDWIPRR